MVTPMSLMLALSLAGQLPGPDGLLATGATLEKLWGEGSFTEGGALAGDGALIFSDIGDRLMRFDPKTRAVTVFREPSGRANGLIFDPEGRLIAAEGANTGGGRRISITDRDGAVRTLADRYQGKRFNSPNDVAVDRRGRVYFSDPRYVGDEPRELDFEAVFRVDPGGAVERLETTARKPNGVAVSADGATLYVADSGPTRRALLALDLGDDGRVSNPRVIHDFGTSRGVDGMTVTADGRVVAAAGSGPEAGAYVFSASGKLLGVIPVPEPPTNVEFAGPDRTTLYVTAGKSLYRVATTMTGFHLWPPR
jgi:gluconolactonase